MSSSKEAAIIGNPKIQLERMNIKPCKAAIDLKNIYNIIT